MKLCFKCGIEKELTEFYKHPKMPDGTVNKCKDCNKNDVKNHTEKLKLNPDWIEKERERSRNKYHKYKHNYNPKTKMIAINNYRGKYPEKYKAKNASQRINKLNPLNHLHHWSYNEEHYKDVIELSVADHAFLHRHIIYDQERKMYRDLKGILLDTKEAHLEYFNQLKNK